ncbi:hypothetical protein EMCRGX_G029743 [Ephydatia muelleri]
MGKRKFRLEQHRKNEERVQRSLIVSVPREMVDISVSSSLTITLPSPSACPVSIPLAVISECVVPSLERLTCNLSLLNPFPAWTVVSRYPSLVLLKFQIHGSGISVNVNRTINYCVSIHQELNWSFSLQNRTVHSDVCSMLRFLPTIINSIGKLKYVLDKLDGAYLCGGNPDRHLLQQWHYNASTLHGLSGKYCVLYVLSSHCVHLGNRSAVLDDSLFLDFPTIRHKQCEMLLQGDIAGHPVRCSVCSSYRRSTLLPQTRCMANHAESNRVNYRYQPVPLLATRLLKLRKEIKRKSIQLSRLKAKVSLNCEASGVMVDEQLHSDLKAICGSLPDSTDVLKMYPKDSFFNIFWQQQMQAAAKKDARMMRWHPLMIRWCLSLRHKSSGAYEALRDSGCLKLPSQRTLRDYTHYIEAKCGFSVEVDFMLQKAAKVESCPERDKCTILLLDEMYIREDLVYNKHSGEMVGFTNLGSINNHLADFEKSVVSGHDSSPSLAKTMAVFMVRGLFTSLQFPYVHFACTNLCGDQMYDPLWEAIWRIENCGLKVLGVTLDGASVNRSLVKLHQSPSDPIPYRTKNPFSGDNRYLYFFSDVPHLVKTVRNCFMSSRRSLWCKGKNIWWSHVKKFYNEDSSAGMGLRMVPKLKYEHLHISSFSAMRVDLAAQVLSESVSQALHLTGGDEASETAHFIGLMDKFFDALNVHNFSHGARVLKPFQMPYTSRTDFRLKWLKEDFLGYLKAWKASVEQRIELTKTEQNLMLLSAETQLGLEMTCMSFLELVPYLFSMPDVQSFLSQRLCQDPLERFFGLQRQRGGVHENPNVVEFAKNTQALRVVKSVCKSSSLGNCRRGPVELANMDELCEPLPKRRRTSGKRSDHATSRQLTSSALEQTETSNGTTTLVSSNASHDNSLTVTCAPVMENELIMGSALYRAMHALLEDDTRLLSTNASVAIHKMAESACQWISAHPNESKSMETTVSSMLQKCMPKSRSIKQHQMWSRYHKLRISPEYVGAWKTFLDNLETVHTATFSPMVYQYVGHFMFKEMVKSHYAVHTSTNADCGLTCPEMYALRYSAGYVPRALKKKLERCKSKKYLLNCLDDMLTSDDAVQCDSTDWIDCIDRGGLTFVNSLTFEVFIAMELEIRSQLQGCKPVNFLTDIAPTVKNNEDVLFFWSMLSSNWDEESSTALFQMVVDLWLTVRGYSYTSAWIEKYKVSQKKSTQKSKGIRKQL